MILVDLVGWWYGRGWAWAFRHLLIERSVAIANYFSFTSLMKTLFAPYRQSFAGGVKGSLGIRFRAFVDRSISRVIGLFVRLTLLFIATVALLFNGVLAVASIVLWPLVPVAPVLGVILFFMGVSNEL